MTTGLLDMNERDAVTIRPISGAKERSSYKRPAAYDLLESFKRREADTRSAIVIEIISLSRNQVAMVKSLKPRKIRATGHTCWYHAIICGSYVMTV